MYGASIWSPKKTKTLPIYGKENPLCPQWEISGFLLDTLSADPPCANAFRETRFRNTILFLLTLYFNPLSGASFFFCYYCAVADNGYSNKPNVHKLSL